MKINVINHWKIGELKEVEISLFGFGWAIYTKLGEKWIWITILGFTVEINDYD